MSKPSTIAGYRALLNSQLLPVFGEKPIESITTPEIEAWIGCVDHSPATRTKALVLFFSVEEVMALVRSAASEQDAAIYLPAAFTGLRRGELLALRGRDVDFDGQVIRVRASYADGALTTPKSGKVRSVPPREGDAAPVAEAFRAEDAQAGNHAR
jgi:integrase